MPPDGKVVQAKSLSQTDIAEMQTFFVNGQPLKHPFLDLNPEWTPLAASGDGKARKSGSCEDPNGRLWGPRRAAEGDQHQSSDDLPADALFHGTIPKMFFPLRFHLPDLPLKIVKPQQVELDETLGVYLPKTLVDDEFKTELEEELLRMMPEYASMNRFFGQPMADSIPPLRSREKWLVRKRYTKLAALYKHHRQILRQELLQKWRDAAPSFPKPLPNTQLQLAAFRNSRPDWRSYLLFVRTFAHRYDYLPKILSRPLPNLPAFPSPGKLYAFAKELNHARLNRDPKRYARDIPDGILHQYKQIRRRRQIERRKREIAASKAAEKAEAELQRNAGRPPVAPRNFGSRKNERRKEYRRLLTFKERVKLARKRVRNTRQRRAFGAEPRRKEPIREISVEEKIRQAQVKRRAKRCARRAKRLMRIRELKRNLPKNPFRIYPQGENQLKMVGINFGSLGDLADCTPVRTSTGLECKQTGATGSGGWEEDEENQHKKKKRGDEKPRPVWDAKHWAKFRKFGFQGKGRKYFRFIKRPKTLETRQMVQFLHHNEFATGQLLSQKKISKLKNAKKFRDAKLHKARIDNIQSYTEFLALGLDGQARHPKKVYFQHLYTKNLRRKLEGTMSPEGEILDKVALCKLTTQVCKPKKDKIEETLKSDSPDLPENSQERCPDCGKIKRFREPSRAVSPNSEIKSAESLPENQKGNKSPRKTNGCLANDRGVERRSQSRNLSRATLSADTGLLSAAGAFLPDSDSSDESNPSASHSRFEPDDLICPRKPMRNWRRMAKDTRRTSSAHFRDLLKIQKRHAAVKMHNQRLKDWAQDNLEQPSEETLDEMTTRDLLDFIDRSNLQRRTCKSKSRVRAKTSDGNCPVLKRRKKKKGRSHRYYVQNKPLEQEIVGQESVEQEWDQIDLEVEQELAGLWLPRSRRALPVWTEKEERLQLVKKKSEKAENVLVENKKGKKKSKKLQMPHCLRKWQPLVNLI